MKKIPKPSENHCENFVDNEEVNRTLLVNHDFHKIIETGLSITLMCANCGLRRKLYFNGEIVDNEE